MMIKILIADDHPLVREGLNTVLSGLNDAVDVIEAESYASAKASIELHSDLDLVLLDLSMPGMHGSANVRELRQLIPSIPIAIISASEDQGDIRNALNAGANGYIPKSSNNEVMRNAISLILAGGLYLPPQSTESQVLGNKLAADSTQLTTRQTEIVSMLAIGKTNKEIARELLISEKTVKAHLAEIFKRLGANNRTQAVHHALSRGLVLAPSA